MSDIVLGSYSARGESGMPRVRLLLVMLPSIPISLRSWFRKKDEQGGGELGSRTRA